MIKRTEQLSKQSTASWHKWVQEQLGVGVGGLHKLSKRTAMTFTEPVEKDGAVSLSSQDILDHDRAVWQEVWHRHADVATAPWREQLRDWQKWCTWAPRLPAIRAEDIRKAAKTFKAATALGVDGFRPRWLTLLSDELLDAYGQLLGDIESIGIWPNQVMTILIAQLPKPDGGRRPIGLLPTIVRVWERIR